MDSFTFEVLFESALLQLEGFKRRVILGQDPTSAFHEVRRNLREERDAIIRGFKWAEPYRRAIPGSAWPGLREAFGHAVEQLGTDCGFEHALAELQSHLLEHAILSNVT